MFDEGLCVEVARTEAERERTAVVVVRKCIVELTSVLKPDQQVELEYRYEDEEKDGKGKETRGKTSARPFH